MADFESLFVSMDVHERSIVLPDGAAHVLHFRELPAVEFRKFQLAERSQDEDVRSGSMARLIAASLCDAEGKPAITVAKAMTLKPSAANALIEAVLEVNGVGGGSEQGKG